MNHPIKDPYGNCEAGQCNHDLAQAVTIGDLLGTDGPFPLGHTIVHLGPNRSTLFDELDSPQDALRAS